MNCVDVSESVCPVDSYGDKPSTRPAIRWLAVDCLSRLFRATMIRADRHSRRLPFRETSFGNLFTRTEG